VNKAFLRTEARSRLASLKPEDFAASGQDAARQLFLRPGWDGFCSMLAFISLPDEIDTQPVLETAFHTGKRVFVPCVEGESLEFRRIFPADSNPVNLPVLRRGRFGIWEPESGPVLDTGDFPVLAIVPGLAFDGKGGRLGRGRGYYDRFFAGLDAAGLPYTAAGFCVDCQLVERIPVDSWDRIMDCVLAGRCRGSQTARGKI
jgi:5-formyltetrahydrofolate cyclo-ligase